MKRKRKFIRYVHAQWHYFILMVRECWMDLVVFLALVVAGASFLYASKKSDASFVQCVHTTFRMMFLDFAESFPKDNVLVEILFFALPIIGLFVIAQGLGHLGLFLFKKQYRLEDWQMSLASTYSNHIIIIGLGRVGYSTLRHLITHENDIVVVEKEKNDFVDIVRAQKIPVVIANGAAVDILRQVGCEKARTIMVLTDDDLVNLEIALHARDLNPKIRVILRMFNETLAHKIEKAFDIGISFSTSALSAPAFAAAVYSRRIMSSVEIEGYTLHMAKFVIGPTSPLIGRRICDIEREYDLTIILHKNTIREDLHPDPTGNVAAADTIIIMADLDKINLFESLAQMPTRSRLPDDPTTSISSRPKKTQNIP